MKSHYFEPTGKWKEQATALFFVEHIGINEIAVIVKKARETVSRYISNCDGYDSEMNFRKKRSAVERKEYQRQWDRENRAGRFADIDGESLRREHDLAALILSKEMRY